MRNILAVLTVMFVTVTMLAGCQNVADIGNPTGNTTTSAASTTATTAPTTATTPTTTIHDATMTTTPPNDTPEDIPAVILPEENRSPNVSYYVEESASVSPSFFDDAVFVGDSVSLKLMYYNIASPDLGNATFLASGSLGVANAMWDLDRTDAVHPSLNGEIVTVTDGVTRSGASKLYFMLGINDLGLYGVEQTVENFKTLTAKILEHSPGLTMYIQSVTPLYADYGSLTNAKVNEYNTAISEYCREMGWYFVDVASVMRDDSGRLRYEYCSDPDGMGIHFTTTACELWCDYLATHT